MNELRTLAEIKAEFERMKATRKMRENAAACLANGDLDVAAKRLFMALYGRPYDVADFVDSKQSCELEYCRSIVRNPLAVYDCDMEVFAKVVAEVAAGSPERDAREADRAVAAGTASRLPESVSHERQSALQDKVDPWAEFDGYRYELGPDTEGGVL